MDDKFEGYLNAVNRPLSSRIRKVKKVPHIEIKENMVICSEEDLNSYSAALITDFIRYMMLEQRVNFSFETVMSHPGKINFLKIAKEKSYKTYLYFIATEDYEINISRVHNRVRKGGHDVPEDKIKNRYHRSLDLLYKALLATDRAYIIDNSSIYLIMRIII